MTEDGEDAVWCDHCRRFIVRLNPDTMEPAHASYDGSCLVIHDDVPHPESLFAVESLPN